MTLLDESLLEALRTALARGAGVAPEAKQEGG